MKDNIFENRLECKDIQAYDINARILYAKKFRPSQSYKFPVALCTMVYDGGNNTIRNIHYHHNDPDFFHVTTSRNHQGAYDFFCRFRYGNPSILSGIATMMDDVAWNKRCMAVQISTNESRIRVILTDTGSNNRCDGSFSLTIFACWGTQPPKI